MKTHPEKVKISAVILARNEEDNLPFCLATLTWCDEIIVVDMESSDRTVQVAQKFGARVFRHPVIPIFDNAKKFAVEQASGEWILMIDADEMITKVLANSLLAAATEDQVDIVRVPFDHYILGEIVRHSGWDYNPQPRFFRKGKVVFNPRIHAYFREADGVASLNLPLDDEHAIQHFNYRDSSHFIEKLNRYTDIEALHLYDAGVQFSISNLLRAGYREFYRRFIQCRGFRGGPRGWSLCLMMAFYRVLSYIKLWEKREFSRKSVEEIYEERRQSILKEWERSS